MAVYGCAHAHTGLGIAPLCDRHDPCATGLVRLTGVAADASRGGRALPRELGRGVASGGPDVEARAWESRRCGDRNAEFMI